MDKIEVTTEYTYPTFRKFSNFASYRRSTGRIVFWTAFAVIMVVCAIVGLIASLQTQDYSFAAYLIGFVVFYTVFLTVLPRIAYKGQIAGRGMVDVTTFTEENITVVTKGKVGEMNQTFFWNALHSAYDTKGFFYIFIARNQGIIVDKSKMSVQEITWLGALLAGKLGKQYKVK